MEKPDFKNMFDIEDYGLTDLQKAAPDLLEALKKIKLQNEGYAMPTNADWATLAECTRRTIRICESAIAKAEGEKQG